MKRIGIIQESHSPETFRTGTFLVINVLFRVFSPQTLYTYPENWRAFKALIAAQYSGAQVRVLSAPAHFHFGQTNRTPKSLHKFPAGKVPAFEGEDGFCVFESNAIAYYVSNEELQRSTPEAAAQVVQWVSFADSDIVSPASTWVLPTWASCTTTSRPQRMQRKR